LTLSELNISKFCLTFSITLTVNSPGVKTSCRREVRVSSLYKLYTSKNLSCHVYILILSVSKFIFAIPAKEILDGIVFFLLK